MKFFDTHIHLTDFKDVSKNILIENLKQNGIEKCVCISAHRSDWEKVAEFAHDFPFEIVPAFGLHPWYADEATDNWQLELEEYLKEFPESVIGECGFDWLKSKDLELERQVFEKQIELAFEYQRPLMLHMVKADLLLENYWGRLPQKSIFHSFSGSIELLKKLLKFSHYISVNHKFFNKKNAKEILTTVPLEKLLLETDAPYQSKAEDLLNVLNKIAEIKNEETETLSKKIYLNTMRVFIDD